MSRTSGHIVGNLRKYVATGSPTMTFEVGDATTYAPATLSFSIVAIAGDLTVSTTPGDHSALASSAIDPAASVNRFWTLSGPSILFSSFDATFTFGAGDVDAGADTC